MADRAFRDVNKQSSSRPHAANARWTGQKEAAPAINKRAAREGGCHTRIRPITLANGQRPLDQPERPLVSLGECAGAESVDRKRTIDEAHQRQSQPEPAEAQPRITPLVFKCFDGVGP